MYGYFGQYPPKKLTRIIYYLPNFLRLFWMVFRDPRIAWYKKVIPVIGGILALSYVLFPFDILPDFVTFLGQLDDLTVVLLFMIPPNKMERREPEIFVLIYCIILLLTPILVLIYALSKAFSDHKRCCKNVINHGIVV